MPAEATTRLRLTEFFQESATNAEDYLQEMGYTDPYPKDFPIRITIETDAATFYENLASAIALLTDNVNRVTKALESQPDLNPKGAFANIDQSVYFFEQLISAYYNAAGKKYPDIADELHDFLHDAQVPSTFTYE